MSARPLDISVREALKIADDEGSGWAYVHGDDGKVAAVVLTPMRAEVEIEVITKASGPERWAHTYIDLDSDHPDATGDHVLEVTHEGWSLEHPRRCRDGGQRLLDCPAQRAAQLSLIAGGVPGRYRVRVDGVNPDKLVFLGQADA